MKIKNLIITSLLALTLVGCGETPTNSNGANSNNDSSSITNEENKVKIDSIKAIEETTEEQQLTRKMKKELNSDEVIEGYNYVIIKKDQTDVQFTITLDNPESYGIDALRITCDDLEAQIQVDGEWKPIAQEKDNTRVVNWSSEDPYEKTYNIRTTSLEDLYTFKVVDIRLAGQDTFLSKQTRSTDFGNNELDIYKMDVDAYELDVAYNTFDEIKFKMNVKEGVSNISNFKVDGNEADSDGYWIMNESKKDVEISYDFELDNGKVINRKYYEDIELVGISTNMVKHNRGWFNANYSGYGTESFKFYGYSFYFCISGTTVLDNMRITYKDIEAMDITTSRGIGDAYGEEHVCTSFQLDDDYLFECMMSMNIDLKLEVLSDIKIYLFDREISFSLGSEYYDVYISDIELPSSSDFKAGA